MDLPVVVSLINPMRIQFFPDCLFSQALEESDTAASDDANPRTSVPSAGFSAFIVIAEIGVVLSILKIRLITGEGENKSFEIPTSTNVAD